MGRTTTRTLEDRAAGVYRQINALRLHPEEWEPDDLRLLIRLETCIGQVRAAVIEGMRTHGVTDRQIGDALGITQQAVSKRWPGNRRYVGAAGRYREPAGGRQRER